MARVVLVQEVVVLMTEDHVMEVDEDNFFALVQLLRNVLHGERKVVFSNLANLVHILKYLLWSQPYEFTILAAN